MVVPIADTVTARIIIRRLSSVSTAGPLSIAAARESIFDILCLLNLEVPTELILSGDSDYPRQDDRVHCRQIPAILRNATLGFNEAAEARISITNGAARSYCNKEVSMRTGRATVALILTDDERRRLESLARLSVANSQLCCSDEANATAGEIASIAVPIARRRVTPS
jgi:hypothetical protein